jgi:endonuclease III
MKVADAPAVNRILAREFRKHRAPVVDFIQAQTRDPFKVLVTTILSARTRDETTTAVTHRLFAEIGSLDDLRAVALRRLEKLIFPVGFYRNKAQHLKALPGVLDDLFGGRIPATVDELCRLPGVGRKTANLVVAIAFGKPAVCVDVHVHRICNRLGLLCTRTPLETEMTLRRILPVRYWRLWNSRLVSFGQTVCLPRRPRCTQCAISRFCDRVGVQD